MGILHFILDDFYHGKLIRSSIMHLITLLYPDLRLHIMLFSLASPFLSLMARVLWWLQYCTSPLLAWEQQERTATGCWRGCHRSWQIIQFDLIHTEEFSHLFPTFQRGNKTRVGWCGLVLVGVGRWWHLKKNPTERPHFSAAHVFFLERRHR